MLRMQTNRINAKENYLFAVFSLIKGKCAIKLHYDKDHSEVM